MKAKTGPESLPQIEDRLLFQLVEFTGDVPMMRHEGISWRRFLDCVAGDIDTADERSAYQFIYAAFRNLESEGLVETSGAMGMNLDIVPTRPGRKRVSEWRDKWEQQRQTVDRSVQQRILQELDGFRRNNPENYRLLGQIDVEALCADLVVDRNTYLANAQRLLDQGKIKESPYGDQMTIASGQAFITERGLQSLEHATTAPAQQRGAEEAWNEVARLRRQLQIAQRDLPSFIHDQELRERCEDILAAHHHYDRVIREACVILENRVRAAANAPSSLGGTSLMEHVFSAKNPRLRLSDDEQEQRGAMNIYSGIMALVRNRAGHHLVNTYTQEDALQFVVWVDLLLTMIGRAGAADEVSSAPQ